MARARSRRLKRLAISRADAVLRRQPALQQVEIADDRRQQIVEIVRDAAGQLAQRLQLLRFVQLGQRDLMLARCAPRPAAPASARQVVQLLEPRARLILAAAAAQRRAGEADQRRRVERPFEEGDVAERLEQAPAPRVALEPAAALGQQDEREVRPFGLSSHPARERAQIGAAQRLLGDEREAGAAPQLARPTREGRRDGSRAARPRAASPPRPPHRGRAAPGSRARSENVRIKASAFVVQQPAARSPTRSGTPRSTPWKAGQRLAERDPVAVDHDIRGSCPRARRSAS